VCVCVFTAIVSDHNYRDLKNNYYNDSMMFCLHMNGGFLYLGLFGERREQSRSDLGDGLLVDELQAFVDGVRANNTALACVQDHTAHAGIGALSLRVFGEETIRIDDKLQGDIAVLEELDFLLHECLVLFAGLLEDLIDKGEIALAAADVDLSLHKLDKALHNQELEELAVLSLISKLALYDLFLGLFVDTLNVGVDSLHLLDACVVLGSGPLDLELNLILGKTSPVFI